MTETNLPTPDYFTPRATVSSETVQFRPLHTLCIALVTLIGTGTAVSLALMFFLSRQYMMLQAIKSHVPISMASARFNDRCVNGGGVLAPVLFVPSAIVWLVWFRRAYGNLPLFTQVPKTYSRGASVGYYFIPFYNLVFIPRIVSETWKGIALGGVYGGAIIVTWWLCWIFSGILYQVAGTFSATPGQPPSLDTLRQQTVVYFIANLARVTAGVLAILIVLKISRRQSHSTATIG